MEYRQRQPETYRCDPVQDRMQLRSNIEQQMQPLECAERHIQGWHEYTFSADRQQTIQYTYPLRLGDAQHTTSSSLSAQETLVRALNGYVIVERLPGNKARLLVHEKVRGSARIRVGNTMLEKQFPLDVSEEHGSDDESDTKESDVEQNDVQPSSGHEIVLKNIRNGVIPYRIGNRRGAFRLPPGHTASENAYARIERRGNQYVAIPKPGASDLLLWDGFRYVRAQSQERVDQGREEVKKQLKDAEVVLQNGLSELDTMEQDLAKLGSIITRLSALPIPDQQSQDAIAKMQRQYADMQQTFTTRRASFEQERAALERDVERLQRVLEEI